MKKRIITIIIALLAIITITISAFASAIPLGDVNDDGEVTASDARTVLRIAASLEEADEKTFVYGDINQDMKITASDARIILRIAAHLENIECIRNGHNYIFDKSIKATCTAEGYDLYKCTNCNASEERNIANKAMHDYKLDNTVKATCKSEGYDLYKCTVCDTTKKDNVQPKTAHSFKKGSVVKGTCVSDGYTEYKCSVCGAIEKRDITKAGGHKYEYVSKERINTSDFVGYKSIKKCAYCKKTITTYDVRNANMQIETRPIYSNTAKNIQKKFEEYTYTVEGYDITSKKVVIYGTMDGIDIDGYYYNLDGTLQGPCPHCGTTLGEGKEMCDGGCRLSWG